MSHFTEWRIRCCFVWAVERAIVGRTRSSPEFDIGGIRLNLEFSKYEETYRLKLVCVTHYLDFNVTVHVEDKNRHALPLCSFLACYRYPNPTVWNYAESDILKAIPDFFTNGIIIFLVTIDNSKPEFQFTLEPQGENKSVQEKEVPIQIEDKSVEKKEVPIQIEDKSVQTPSFLNAAPCLESLSEDLSKLLIQDSRPDVTLTCGDLNLRAHRSILSCRSGVFAAMLNNDMTEGHTGQVQIEDVKSEDLQLFVRYLYTGKLPDLTADTARSLYEAADKYAVVGLQKRCASFILEILSPENACEMLALADAHSDQEFKESVLVYILQKEIPLLDEQWSPFCDRHPKIAVEVLNRFYKEQKKA